jgi:PAS domain S-box-containing protein
VVVIVSGTKSGIKTAKSVGYADRPGRKYPATRAKQALAQVKALRGRIAELKATTTTLSRQIARYNKALDQSRRQLEVLHKLPAVAWTVMPDGQCDFVNQFYLNATGLSFEHCTASAESWKRLPGDLPPFLSGLHPDHRERAADIFWGGIRTGIGWVLEVPLLHADGRYHWHIDRAVPDQDSKGNIIRFIGSSVDIEDLRLARESLQGSEQRLLAIIDSSPNVIFLKDTQGRYLLVNKAFERFANAPRDQIIGKNDDEVFGSREIPVFSAGDQEVFQSGTQMQFDGFSETDNGGQKWSIVQRFPIRDASGRIYAAGGVMTDITERKLAEQQLRAAEKQARLILDTSLDAVVTIDTTGAITAWSKRAEEIFGWSGREALDRRIADTIIPAQYRDAHKRGVQRFLETGEAPILNKRIEITAAHKDGHEFPVELTVTAIELGTDRYFSAFLRDLTEKKHAEEALREAREELVRVTRISALGQVTASIAHEINQPLAAILVNADTCLRWLTADKPDLEKASAAARRLGHDARRASDIIAHIRAFTNKSVAEKALLDINQLIRNVLNLTQSQLQKGEVTTKLDLQEQLPPINGDGVQLQQVILNLILNGLESMLLVDDRPRTLFVKSKAKDTEMVEVSFHDTGAGFDQTVAHRIFDAFFTTKLHGTGMGLAICRSIIEAHEGLISAMPAIPFGAIFQLRLPAAIRQD